MSVRETLATRRNSKRDSDLLRRLAEDAAWGLRVAARLCAADEQTDAQHAAELRLARQLEQRLGLLLLRVEAFRFEHPREAHAWWRGEKG